MAQTWWRCRCRCWVAGARRALGRRAVRSADRCPRDGHQDPPLAGSRSAETNGAPWLANYQELSTMRDGGHDFLSDLKDPASLAAGLAAQALKRLPLAQALLGDQRPLGLLDHHPGVQGPLELDGQLPPLLALHGVGD